jgi:perosamine synthetase
MSQYSELISFIRSTFHEPDEFIPLHDPRFIGNEKKYLNECIDFIYYNFGIRFQNCNFTV